MLYIITPTQYLRWNGIIYNLNIEIIEQYETNLELDTNIPVMAYRHLHKCKYKGYVYITDLNSIVDIA